jgi:hypothetical protein
MSSWDSPQGSRPFICNQTDWAFGHGTTDPAAEQATSIASFDLYPITSPWNANSNIPIISGQPQDSLWIQGYSVVVFRQKGRPNQPVWSYLDTGTDELGYSSQNGSTCNYSTNLCTPNNHEARATNEHVNAEAWNGLINGAVGVEWFCQDSTSYSFCLGDPTSSASSVAASVFANLTYVNGTILSYAQQLNSPTAGICTMITGTQYSNYTSTCSNGILSVSTGTASVPANALVKNYNGVHYLVAAPAHNGQTNLTFTLTGDVGKTATVVYDSNDHYDPAHSSVGQTFTLDGSGQFTDTFGANDHNYQPKVYRMQ